MIHPILYTYRVGKFRNMYIYTLPNSKFSGPIAYNQTWSENFSCLETQIRKCGSFPCQVLIWHISTPYSQSLTHQETQYILGEKDNLLKRVHANHLHAILFFINDAR